jgi:hypothetical protein
MTQSTIGFVVALIALLLVAFMQARRYRRDHPGEGIGQWLDTHHMSWMHRRH